MHSERWENELVTSVLNRTYNLMVMDMPNGLYRDFGSLNVLNGSILENLCAQIRSRVWEATRICRADSEGGKGMDIGKLYSKYKDVLFYLFFGVCTTAVNVVAYWAAAHLLRFGTMPSTILAWVFAVTFAYITNRKWVFHSNASRIKEIVTEIGSFFVCRLATGGVDWVCMLVLVEFMGLNDVMIKFLANVVVIALNYAASKMIIFRAERKKEGMVGE